MPIDLYYMPVSPPCRSVMLTAKALGVELNLKLLNVLEGENVKPEFVAINPQHCIPTLVDGNLKLWESRAICTYLIAQYGKDDSLYPPDPKTRALVDRLLYFDIGTLYHRFGEYVYPVMFFGQEKLDPAKLEKLHEALGWLDGYLAGHDWAAGNSITVADFVLVASVSSFEVCGIDLSKYRNVTTWLARCKAGLRGYDEANAPGVKDFARLTEVKLAGK